MFGLIGELRRFKSLFWGLVQRHLAARYRGSALGFLWTFLNPLCLICVYWLVFRFYIRFTQVENYTVFMFAGLLPWMWATQALMEGTASISGSGHLITKSLFPAHILPAVTVTTSLINFVLSLPILFALMYFTGVPLKPTLFFIPLVIFVQSIFLYGLVLLLSSLNVFYRDIQHLLGNALTLLFFLCPIVYPESVVPAQFKWTIQFNPFAAFISIYQGLILEGSLPSLNQVILLSSISLFSYMLGSMVYSNLREKFAELL
jgi:lipopolysaccharide transport system permease protein